MKKIVPVFCIIFGLFSCNHPTALFQKAASSETGITFNNRIIENDSLNPIDLEFLYNGTGIVAGDFNNSWQWGHIYFLSALYDLYCIK